MCSVGVDTLKASFPKSLNFKFGMDLVFIILGGEKIKGSSLNVASFPSSYRLLRTFLPCTGAYTYLCSEFPIFFGNLNAEVFLNFIKNRISYIYIKLSPRFLSVLLPRW
jgi:hypothetical protein